RGLREEAAQAYFPYLEGNDAGATFYLKVHGDPDLALRMIRATVRSVDPTLPIIDFRTVNDQLNRSLSTEHLLATLSGSFSALAFATIAAAWMPAQRASGIDPTDALRAE